MLGTAIPITRFASASDQAHLRLSAQTDEGGSGPLRGSLVIATAGFNKSGDTYFPPDILKQSAPMFERAKMFLNHDDNDYRVFGRRFEEEVGFLENVKYSDKEGRLEADFTVFHAEMAENIRARNKAGAVDSARVSLSIIGQVAFEEMDTPSGRSTVRVVQSVETVESVDFVAFDAANGYLIKLEQSLACSPLYVSTTTDKISFSAPNPMESNTTPQEDDSTMSKEALDELTKKVEDLSAQVKQSGEANAKLTAENAELKQSLVRTSGEKLLAEANLPEVCKTPIANLLDVEGITVDAIKQAISDKEGELKGLAEAGLLVRNSAETTHPKGPEPVFYPVGEGTPGTPATPATETESPSSKEILKQSLAKSLIRRGVPKDEAESRAEKAVA